MKKAIPFFVSQAVTLFGSQIVAFAIVWYITLETESGLWVALLSICSFVPQFLMSFIGGALADRYSKKTLIIASDAAIALFTLALVLLMPLFSEGLTLRFALLAVAALRSVATGIQTPAVNSSVPLLVQPEELMRANGINSTFQSVANFAAPAAAGALMSLISLEWTLMIDVATAVIGITILSFISFPDMANRQSHALGGFFSDIREGVRYSLSDKSVMRVLLLFGAFIFLSIPGGFLANLFVARTFGDSYAYLSAVEIVGFAGMMLGGILMGTWGGFINRYLTLLVSVVLFGSFGVALGLSLNFIFYLVIMLLYGIPLTSYQTATTTILQERVEEQMQGRVFGLLNSIYSGFLPLGMAIFGPLADVVPLRVLTVSSSIALMLLSTIVILEYEKVH